MHINVLDLVRGSAFEREEEDRAMAKGHIKDALTVVEVAVGAAGASYLARKLGNAAEPRKLGPIPVELALAAGLAVLAMTKGAGPYSADLLALAGGAAAAYATRQGIHFAGGATIAADPTIGQLPAGGYYPQLGTGGHPATYDMLRAVGLAQ